MFKGILVAVVLVLSYPSAAVAYEECGNPRGPAENVTAVKVACDDAREFARKVAKRRVTKSGLISLLGWHTYSARVRRIGGGKYDVRATRGPRVVRFQYRWRGGGGRGCDRNYSGCLNPNASDY